MRAGRCGLCGAALPDRRGKRGRPAEYCSAEHRRLWVDVTTLARRIERVEFDVDATKQIISELWRSAATASNELRSRRWRDSSS